MSADRPVAGLAVTPESLRRVVTAVGPDGRSTVVTDGVPGLVRRANDWIEYADVWSTPSVPPEVDPLADAGATAPTGLDLADPRGTFCRIARYGPDPEGIDPRSMFHTTPTVDYVMILSGSIDVLYQDGTSVALRPGDLVVQRGVAHAWSNTSGEDCIMLSVRVGAPDHGVHSTGWRPE